MRRRLFRPEPLEPRFLCDDAPDPPPATLGGYDPGSDAADDIIQFGDVLPIGDDAPDDDPFADLYPPADPGDPPFVDLPPVPVGPAGPA